MTDSVALLGVKGGPAIRPGSRMPTSCLLTLGGRRIVVDCGLGVARGLCDRGMALTDLDLIFVTHLHSDHYLELGPLLHTAWTAGLGHPVTVVGPTGLPDYWRHFCAAMAFDIDLRIADEGLPDLRGLARFLPLSRGEVFRDGDLVVTALPNRHPPIAESYALRFRAGGRAVVFSGDTAPFEGFADFARGADLLVHEAMLEAAVDALVARNPNADHRLKIHLMQSHTPAPDVARLATEAGVGALALHHLLPADDPDYGADDWRAAVRPHWSGPLHVGEDGMTITLEDAT